MSDPKPKRTPAGAAVPGAVERPINYPKTIVVMVSEETHRAIEVTASKRKVAKSEIVRTWLEHGRKRSSTFPDATR